MTGVGDAYEFGPEQRVELKGRGPTPAHVLLGRHTDAEIPATPATERVVP